MPNKVKYGGRAIVKNNSPCWQVRLLLPSALTVLLIRSHFFTYLPSRHFMSFTWDSTASVCSANVPVLLRALHCPTTRSSQRWIVSSRGASYHMPPMQSTFCLGPPMFKPPAVSTPSFTSSLKIYTLTLTIVMLMLGAPTLSGCAHMQVMWCVLHAMSSFVRVM